ncbi:hypothetical protein BDZ89DRAFT_1063608 [Hymenopellis radicata]|nr:hypothetical protein BDZ89DRAFT_1063608 [Hymenopellis radicata]
MLCKILVLSDDSRRAELEDLAFLFPEWHWQLCIHELYRYFRSDDGRKCYNTFREHFHLEHVPCYDRRRFEELEYSLLDDMLVDLSRLCSQSSVATSYNPRDCFKSSTCETPVSQLNIPEPYNDGHVGLGWIGRLTHGLLTHQASNGESTACKHLSSESENIV